MSTHVRSSRCIRDIIYNDGETSIFFGFFVNLEKVSMIVFNTISICYKFQSLLILDIHLLSAFL